MSVQRSKNTLNIMLHELLDIQKAHQRFKKSFFSFHITLYTRKLVDFMCNAPPVVCHRMFQNIEIG